MENYLNTGRLAGLYFFAAVIMLISTPSMADAWQQAWSARASTEYDSNPAMVLTDPIDIWRYLFEPSYKLMKTDGANELDAGLAFLIARSSDQTLSQNREDPTAFLGWRQRNETDEFGMTVKYNESSTRTTEIDNTGPGFIDGTRKEGEVSAYLSNALSERSTVALNTAYKEISYKDGGFVDYVSRSAGVMANYAWSEGSAPFVKVSFTDYKPADGSPLSSLSHATLGWDWKFSDYLDGTLQAGASKTSGVKMGTQGAADVQYTGQLSRWNFSADRQVTPSGFGGFITADQVKGGWSYAVSENSKAGIDLGWRKSYFTADIINRSKNIINRTVNTWLHHDFNAAWATQLYYLHKISSSNLFGSASSNIVGISLVYTHSNF